MNLERIKQPAMKVVETMVGLSVLAALEVYSRIEAIEMPWEKRKRKPSQK